MGMMVSQGQTQGQGWAGCWKQWHPPCSHLGSGLAVTGWYRAGWISSGREPARGSVSWVPASDHACCIHAAEMGPHGPAQPCAQGLRIRVWIRPDAGGMSWRMHTRQQCQRRFEKPPSGYSSPCQVESAFTWVASEHGLDESCHSGDLTVRNGAVQRSTEAWGPC